jgi:hypothetical protein
MIFEILDLVKEKMSDGNLYLLDFKLNRTKINIVKFDQFS